MAKDPATLWYWNDFLTGTMTFSRHHKGCYMDVLGAQFNNGRLSLDEIKTVLGPDFGSSWPTLQKKFKQDDKGLFYNEKAEETKNKRANYTQSRRNNLKGDMGDHMENEIENRKLEFKLEVETKLTGEDEKMILDFINYWTEHSNKGKKMRFEMQKVFAIPLRFNTWKRNHENFKTTKTENKLEHFEQQAKLAEEL